MAARSYGAASDDDVLDRVHRQLTFARGKIVGLEHVGENVGVVLVGQPTGIVLGHRLADEAISSAKLSPVPWIQEGRPEQPGPHLATFEAVGVTAGAGLSIDPTASVGLAVGIDALAEPAS